MQLNLCLDVGLSSPKYVASLLVGVLNGQVEDGFEDGFAQNRHLWSKSKM